jgi:hypothetical protein
MKFKQVKGFLLRDFVITGLLFGLVVSLYIIQVGSIADNYNNQEIVSASFADNYDKLSANTANLETSFQSVKSGNGLDLVGTFNVAFNSVFTVVNMMWDSLLIYTNMAGNVADDFNFLDSGTVLIVLSTLIAMITTYLIFVWLSSISRGKL